MGGRGCIFLVILVISATLCSAGDSETSSSEPLTSKEVRKAEATAKTVADHLRLAAYYQAKAHRAQANLTEEEDQMKHWASMADRTKIPNPYWSARALAGMYREELKRAEKLAADHQRKADALEAGSGATQ
jgi:hypothetical protein